MHRRARRPGFLGGFMIIDFQERLRQKLAMEPNRSKRQRGKAAHVVDLPKREPPAFTFDHPLDQAPAAYSAGFISLWKDIHQAITRDLYPGLTESHLGNISNLVIYQVDTWPARLKSLLWRKNGEGCLSAANVEGFERRIDHIASVGNLRPLEVIKAEMNPLRPS